jgi:putative heme-binding domain-containing protein
VGRLDEFKKTDEATDKEIMKLIDVAVEEPAQGGGSLPQKCCGEGNLLAGKGTKASSEESGKGNLAPKAVDGDLTTRWCANGGDGGQWWQVDLGEAKHLKSLRIHWEMDAGVYRYKVEASANGTDWKTIVDHSKNEKKERIISHQVDSPDTKILKITFLANTDGKWGSFWEVEAYAGELPKLPEGVSSNGASSATAKDVQVILAKEEEGTQPKTFDVSLFGVPPAVNYPVCLSCAPTGEVFVGVDEQGSLGKEPGGGKVLRCIDTDGDGRADKINTFAKMDHPRGLIYDDGSLWVLHPPLLSVWHDDDRDGTADRHETLVTGLSTDEVEKRGADHTTNGIRMGIDGWIYIAVGDFGFTQAKGKDGVTLARRGGGVVRVRPDGTEMEVYSWGQRNILDVGIDPYLNLFTRDNTNDGGGWDIRVTHVMQSANYGYPSQYINFAEETMPPLAQYGGGSGCGSMYLHDTRWPAPYGNGFYSCDWGTSEVYRHNFPATGPSFLAHQEPFLKIPRPTDIDVDGRGLMYVSSWKDGNFSYSGPNVGFVAQIKPTGFVPKPFPNLATASDEELIGYLASPSAVYRLHSQRELLRRGVNGSRPVQLTALASDAKAPLYGRVAAIFTLKQLGGAAANMALLKLAEDASIREFALRALTDRRSQLANLPLAPFVAALKDENPRTQAQALISLGRIGNVDAADEILALSVRQEKSPRPKDEPLHKQPDLGRVLPHLAMQAIVSLNAVDECLKQLDGPHRAGALLALRNMHDERAVVGLAKKLSSTTDAQLRSEIISTLARLYHREGDYKGGWWGTRPDNVGPYFDRQKWAASDQISAVLKTAASDDRATAELIRKELARHVVKIDGLADPSQVAANAAPEKAITIGAVDPQNTNLIGNIGFEDVLLRASQAPGDAKKGQELFARQSCIQCHTSANGQTPNGPHLVEIGKRYKRAELIESILRPSAKVAQGFDTYGFVTVEGKVLTGFVVSESADAVTIREASGLSHTLKLADIEERAKRDLSMMPEGIAGNLTPEELADLLAYLESLK